MKENSKYKLYAVSNHMGGMGGGHYTAYAKSLSDQRWYELDDSSASSLGDDPVNTIVSPSAYVLYFAREGLEKK